ncbi:FUSC family protein [Edaphobacter modestus]|uniref:Multidrug resistance protein MdtO n=1 Tax=Edaphobacter modestus TaxID=388466 RepID=A0A4Q7YE10_9BACT|nr:FUSC family protein [Edaphobacter modestus]RZU35198.1 multidrug resistance protein MdtO [Edaphobacter modestus]
MPTTIIPATESSGFFPWFRDFLKKELSPFPGRATTVARMVLAATITMLIIMTFRIPGGALGAMYAFFVSRDNMRATLTSGLAIAVSYIAGATFILTGASLFADQQFAQFLWFSASMFVVFFALSTFADYAVATGFAAIVVNAMLLWQRQDFAHVQVDATLWQLLAVAIGTSVTVAIEIVFHAFHKKDELTEGIDGRLHLVQQLLESYRRQAAVPDEIQRKLEQYTIVGVGALRRGLARSNYERLYHDQTAAVISLSGRLVDLSAASIRVPHQAQEEDKVLLENLENQIAQIRTDLQAKQAPRMVPAPPGTPSGFPLLAEIQRTILLIPEVFSGAKSIDRYIPSIKDEPRSSQFFVRDAFSNPLHIRYAVQGCLAATLCYFTYFVLDWRGLGTSVVTCVFTALSNAGTSRQKQVLRITGAIAGGVLFGIGSQVFILPNIDSITAFSLLFAAVTGVAAWFATSSQRLSYFGVQIANAFYLVNLQEFSIQTSLVIARDRVLGILLGLIAMWLVFDGLGTARATDQMAEAFINSLMSIARLTIRLEQGNQQTIVQDLRALREEINSHFQMVNSQSDAILFEFGIRRKQGMAMRALVRSWQPSLRVLVMMEAALIQHRLLGSEHIFSQNVRGAWGRFDDACAQRFLGMANHLEGKDVSEAEPLSISLKSMERALLTEHGVSDDRSIGLGIVDLAHEVATLVDELFSTIVNTRIPSFSHVRRVANRAASKS